MKIENGTSLICSRPYRIKVNDLLGESEKWEWCCKHLVTGTWGQAIGIMGTTITYLFDSEADAILFLLKWSK